MSVFNPYKAGKHEKCEMKPIKVRIVNRSIYPNGLSDCKNGDWIDLRVVKDYELKKGESALLDLGVAMRLPDGYEAHLVPRSSTFKNWHIIQTNSMGIIDNKFSGENDIWKMPVLAITDTVIRAGDRVCQFRIEKKMNNKRHPLVEVEHLEGPDRGGFGSTGTN